MKQFSLLLNIILFLAVAFLYYLHFSVKKEVVPKKTHAQQIVASSVPATQPNIAYVELDSLNEKISYIRNRRKELEAEQQAIENEWENGYRGLENQKNAFIKQKGQSITQEEAQEFQGQLMEQQQRIDQKKQTLSQSLSEKSYKFMDDIQKKLKEFLEEYNRENSYNYIFTTGTGLDYMVYKDSSMNITADVVAGMNLKLNKPPK